jgi:hypothetical protein
MVSRLRQRIHRIERAGGDDRPCSVCGDPLGEGSGGPVCVIVAGRDDETDVESKRCPGCGRLQAVEITLVEAKDGKPRTR